MAGKSLFTAPQIIPKYSTLRRDLVAVMALSTLWVAAKYRSNLKFTEYTGRTWPRPLRASGVQQRIFVLHVGACPVE
jgi:hypothetical protein